MGGLPAADPAGGSVELDELLEEHGQAIKFDLIERGVDIRGLWWPGSGVTPRHVLSLVGQLPVESAFAASVRGGSEFRSWSPQLYVLAAIANLLNAANRQRAGKRSSKPVIKPPASKNKPVPTRVLTVAEIVRRQQAAEKAKNNPN